MKTWKTHSGQIIPIKEMSDTHLINTISFLKRNCENYRYQIIAEGENALGFLQGEMAIDSIERDINSLLSMADDEFLQEYTPYKALVREAKKRKLNL